MNNRLLSRSVCSVLLMGLLIIEACGSSEEEKPISEVELTNNIEDIDVMVNEGDEQISEDVPVPDNLHEFTTAPLEQGGYSLEPVHIHISNCSKEYKIIFLSDLHLLIENDEVAADYTDYIQDRSKDFTGNFEVQWESLSAQLEECNADAILFGGDMLDFCSMANTKLLDAGLKNISAPYMYVRADHDIQPFWLEDQNNEKCQELQNAICDNEDMLFMEFDDFVILGINNNTYQLTEDGLAKAKEVLTQEKPVIILAHVPYYSQVDETLSETARERWPDRKRELIWGPGNAYEPDEITQQLMDLIYADDSPVIQVFSGHLHCMWDGKITENVSEHVFSPAYAGYVGIVSIDGKE